MRKLQKTVDQLTSNVNLFIGTTFLEKVV